MKYPESWVFSLLTLITKTKNRLKEINTVGVTLRSFEKC